MGFNVDFSEFDKYCKEFALFEKNFNQFLQDFLYEMAERVIEHTVPRTPEDTGKLRSSWRIGKVYGSGKNLVIEIENDTPYATEVEYGHAGVYVPTLGKTLHVDTHWTNGRFMLTTSMNEVEKVMPEAFEYRFKEYCRQMGIL